jgi:hypothetical protein
MQGGLVDWDAPLLSALVKQFEITTEKCKTKAGRKVQK